MNLGRHRRRRSDERLLTRVRKLPREIRPPEDLWRGVAARLKGAPRAGAEAPRVPAAEWGFRRSPAGLAPPLRAWGVRPALAAALLLFAGGILWPRLARQGAWQVADASGRYTLTDGRLETSATSRVRLGVGHIGFVTVGPDTRLRLLATRPEHRLALDRGSIAARITAPPRLFYVETPSATAADLGCQYTLAVDATGGGLIHVTVGWVELAHSGMRSVVPFNMSAYTRPGFAPGTPFADHASDALTAALYRFDFERGGAAALATVLAEAKEPDVITLWHLLARTRGAAREAVYRTLAALAPPPGGVTRTAVLGLERRALRAWWDALPGSPGTLPWWQRVAVRVSAWLGFL
jgi:hypothetical protein